MGGIMREPTVCEVTAIPRERSPSSDFLIVTRALRSVAISER
jgi:hypothetical protein